MNKLFLYLIIIGILTLILVAGWEVYQISTGAKSTVNITVVELTKPVLMPKALEDHLKSDPKYFSLTPPVGTGDQGIEEQIPPL